MVSILRPPLEKLCGSSHEVSRALGRAILFWVIWNPETAKRIPIAVVLIVEGSPAREVCFPNCSSKFCKTLLHMFVLDYFGELHFFRFLLKTAQKSQTFRFANDILSVYGGLVAKLKRAAPSWTAAWQLQNGLERLHTVLFHILFCAHLFCDLQPTKAKRIGMVSRNVRSGARVQKGDMGKRCLKNNGVEKSSQEKGDMNKSCQKMWCFQPNVVITSIDDLIQHFWIQNILWFDVCCAHVGTRWFQFFGVVRLFF